MMIRNYPDVALLTEGRYAASTASGDDWYFNNILRDDHYLQEALNEIGVSSVRVDWARGDVDWSRFKCAVFRTTWDYFERISEFNDWLNKVQDETVLLNDVSLIRWNLDKHYLADLTHLGIPVVETEYIEKGTKINLQQLLEEKGLTEGIIKPCISGAARHTYRISHKNACEIQPVIEELLTSESFLFQPFIEDVVKTGEDTLMVIDGRFTHAVRKVAKTGDFRVQDDHGGTVYRYNPAKEQVELAERAIALCNPAPAYGRVDMVRDNDGRWAIMELELIEPELWLRHHPPAAKYFARVIARTLRRYESRLQDAGKRQPSHWSGKGKPPV
jgi:glutathione synthase/RimK-type ligase-like ATP-grasp enzyme